jgi:hypothetical protein
LECLHPVQILPVKTNPLAIVCIFKQLLFFLSLSAAIFLAGFFRLTNTQTYLAHHISNFASDEGQKSI